MTFPEHSKKSGIPGRAAPVWRVIDANSGERPDPEQLSEEWFSGKLIVFRGLDAVGDLVTRARNLVEEAFDSASPWLAETRLPAAAFQEAIRLARRRVQEDTLIRDDWIRVLTALGYAPAEVYRDHMRLRVIPSDPAMRNPASRPLAAHRDTWGSGVMAQINWWLPLYPPAPERTMLLWPGWFDHPVDNNSAEWDFQALKRDRGGAYPLLPVARRTPPDAGEPVLIEPGELLAFSGAHLHAGIADDSGLSRFNLDTRTAWSRDAEIGRGAPDVDGAPNRISHWEMFFR